MILLALRSGLRQGELLGLKWDDIDLAAHGAPFSGARRGWNSQKRQVTGIPLSDDAIAILRSLLSRFPRGLVFCHEHGRMLTKGDCKRPLWRACRKAGHRQSGWHLCGAHSSRTSRCEG